MPRKRTTRRRRVVKKRRRVRSSKGSESYRKGQLFEEVVSRYFELHGYKVRRNVKVTGLSGATHEIDVFIEKDGVNGVVEAKNYSKPIPKEWVMKIYNVAKDIGAKEAYIVSASGFTDDAVKVAKVLGVKLLDLNNMYEEVKRITELQSSKILFMTPAYDAGTARKFAKRFATKRFLSYTEEVSSIELIYLPIYIVTLEHRYYEQEGLIFKKTVERLRPLKISVSATTPSLLLATKAKGNTYEVSFIEIPQLSDSELEVLSYLVRSGKQSYRGLLELTRWSKQKLTRVLNTLIRKELIYREDSAEVYLPKIPSLYALEATVNTIIDETRLKTGYPDEGRILEPLIPGSHIESLIRRIYGEIVKDVSLIYIPIYKVTLKKKGAEAYRHIYLLSSIPEIAKIENILYKLTQ